MTELSRNAKRAVRARMRRTGESYMTARRNWLASKADRPDTLPPEPAVPSSPLAPFEEFLKGSERVLLIHGSGRSDSVQATVRAMLQSPGPFLIRCNEHAFSAMMEPWRLSWPPEHGTPVVVEGSEFFVDGMAEHTWAHSPQRASIALAYPVDTWDDETAPSAVADLKRRATKVILISSYVVVPSWAEAIGVFPVERDHSDPAAHERITAVAAEIRASWPRTKQRR